MPRSALSAAESSQRSGRRRPGGVGGVLRHLLLEATARSEVRCWGHLPKGNQDGGTRGDKLGFHKNDFSIGPSSQGRERVKRGSTHLPSPCVRLSIYFHVPGAGGSSPRHRHRLVRLVIIVACVPFCAPCFSTGLSFLNTVSGYTVSS